MNKDGGESFSHSKSLWLDDSHTVKIYPVPASDFLQIKTDEIYRLIEIFDLNGKILIHKNWSNQSKEIDISDLNNGVYFIRLSNDKATLTEQFIKQ